MLKRITLKITKIEYTSVNIGNDIDLEIKCLDKFKSISKKLRNRSESEINLEIGSFFNESNTLKLPIEMKVIEKDLIFVGEPKSVNSGLVVRPEKIDEIIDFLNSLTEGKKK